MFRQLVPLTMLAAMLAFAVAAMTVGATPIWPRAWPAAVSLAVLGGIIPMIMAVTIRIMPVFARRSWAGPRWLVTQVSLMVSGAWVVFAGSLGGLSAVRTLGLALALLGALFFLWNIIALMHQTPTTAALPPPDATQAAVDRIATRFTQLAVSSLVLGTSLGVLTSIWPPAGGRWELVWAHALLVGCFLSMAMGVCYHVLARWTGRPWRSARPMRWHLALTLVALPLMLLALATDQLVLFALAGPVQAAAVMLFISTVTPQIRALPGLTRRGMIGAMTVLGIGIGMGAWFALNPAAGAELRLVHACLNLFGGGGLLISGVAYYLVPRFAGQPLRWPRLAGIQLVVLGAGVGIGVLARLWWIASDGAAPAWPIMVGQGVVALGFALLGLVIGGTFFQRQPARGTGASIQMMPRPQPLSRPGMRSGGGPASSTPPSVAAPG